jgi:2-(1,2-epoxy-1,2-dihydrophenyl)acetyl-CoA isomerase
MTHSDLPKEPEVPTSVQYDLAEGVATITLSRPEAMNSLTAETKTRLREAVERARDETAVRAVVLTGSGRAFCAGQDLREHATNLEAGLGLAGTLEDHYEPIISALIDMPKPVIAAVNGVAAGAGFSFALACDLRIASDRARLGDTSGRFGLLPDEGGTWLFPRAMGLEPALRMSLLGEVYPAEEALRLGLVGQVVPAADLEEETAALARRLAAAAPLAVTTVRRLMRSAQEQDLHPALEALQLAVDVVNRSQDVAEGVAAFVERRPPRFRGA